MALLIKNCKVEHATYTTSHAVVDGGTSSFWSVPLMAGTALVYRGTYKSPAWRTKREKVDAGLARLEHNLTEFFRRGWKI